MDTQAKLYWDFTARAQEGLVGGSEQTPAASIHSPSPAPVLPGGFALAQQSSAFCKEALWALLLLQVLLSLPCLEDQGRMGVFPEEGGPKEESQAARLTLELLGLTGRTGRGPACRWP